MTPAFSDPAVFSDPANTPESENTPPGCCHELRSDDLVSFVCERPEGHPGRHHFTLVGSQIMTWQTGQADIFDEVPNGDGTRWRRQWRDIEHPRHSPRLGGRRGSVP